MRAAAARGSAFHLSGRGALALGIGLGVAFIVGLGIYTIVERRASEPTQAADCFEKHQANYLPGAASPPMRNAHMSNKRHDAEYIASLKDAERLCTTRSCAGAALAQYRGALAWYLAERMNHMRWLDFEFGEAGVMHARQLYRTPDDLHIERGLRERYQARLFRINDSAYHRDVMSILIFKGGEAMRPCNKARAAG